MEPADAIAALEAIEDQCNVAASFMIGIMGGSAFICDSDFYGETVACVDSPPEWRCLKTYCRGFQMDWEDPATVDLELQMAVFRSYRQALARCHEEVNEIADGELVDESELPLARAASAATAMLDAMMLDYDRAVGNERRRRARA